MHVALIAAEKKGLEYVERFERERGTSSGAQPSNTGILLSFDSCFSRSSSFFAPSETEGGESSVEPPLMRRAEMEARTPGGNEAKRIEREGSRSRRHLEPSHCARSRDRCERDSHERGILKDKPKILAMNATNWTIPVPRAMSLAAALKGGWGGRQSR